MNVLVTGAGGPAGVAVVRELARRGYRVAAVDHDPLAAGLRLAHDAAVVGSYGDPDYVASLCSAARRFDSTILVSTLAEELPRLFAERDELAAGGLRTWLPEPAAVGMCLDKWEFAEAMAAVRIPSPATSLGCIDGTPAPWIVKPRFGRGSRDVFAVDDPRHLSTALSRVADPIVQHRLDGREFTVDILVARDGSLAGAVPRLRLETRGGISTKGVTFVDDELVARIRRVVDAVGITGPANVQGFLHDGEATIVEVNPRFSGGLPLSLAAGADLVGEYVRGIAGEPLRPERLTFRAGVTMIRHFEEVFEG